jgi:DNA polymerase elongation subunit (family B)
MKIPKSFWEDVEQELDSVLYSDTDSLFVNIKSLQHGSSENAIEISKKIGDEINQIISNFYEQELLPKLNIQPDHNRTFFKTEMTANSIIFLDVKKNYAYRETSSKGIARKNPVVKYTGLAVVKTDSSKLTKRIIEELVENIALNLEIKDKKQAIHQLFYKVSQEIKTSLKNFGLLEIGTPKKWGMKGYKKEESTGHLNAMKLYNTLVDQIIFEEGTSGLVFSIKFENLSLIRELISNKNNKLDPRYSINKIPLEKINSIAIPYNYKKEKLEEVFFKYKIKFDEKEIYNSTNVKIIERIVIAINKQIGKEVK